MKQRKSGWKDVLLGAVLMALLAGLMVPALATTGKRSMEADYNDIKLRVDGIPITPKDANGDEVEPFAIDGTTYLPVRAVGEALGKEVRWDGPTRTVYVTTPVDTAD